MSGAGRALCDELRGGATGEVEIEADGVRVRAEVPGAGRYGAEVLGISVERPGAKGAVPAAVDALAERLDYLPEKLQALETEAERGILRTRRDQVRGGEYYELEVRPDAIELGRFRWNPAQGQRDRVPDELSHRVLERLIDDLADTVGSSGEDPQAPARPRASEA